MSIRLQDMKLFLVKDDQPVKIELKQQDDILFNLVTKADRSPINILVPVIEGNQPITIKVNDYNAEILPDNLEMQSTYKLLLENGQLNQEPIQSGDTFALSFKVRNGNTNTQGITGNSVMNGSTLSTLQLSQLRHKLVEQGKGTSMYQSASSLRHSIPEVSFSKAQRFDKNLTLKTEFNYSIPDTIGSQGRQTGFGYGNKFISPLYVQRNAEQNPPPDAYFNEETKQPTKYRKTNWSQSERFKMSQTVQGPSPNSYDVTQIIGQNKPSCTIGARIKPLATFQEKVPASNTYEIKTQIIEPSRFNKITLGYGNKSDFTKNDKTPGPGTYEQPSVFKNMSSSILNNGTLRTNVMRK
ncbi:unnamed protein product [Paramecium pentaurelia]|uniref:Uncharacterized protein n=1 Tax=Paramecium pentaurelia TaxID=43138 RepID=A0A8S1Y9P9_9CILI|nr:unnamed protein product [Paramecium pentaurelia]